MSDSGTSFGLAGKWSVQPSRTQRVQELHGFNKLVRGRHGAFVANENDIYVGRALLHYGEFSEHEFALLSEICQPGYYVAEVGANIGALTVPIAKRVGPKGRVVAYEPQPVIFQNLCANVSLNSFVHVECINTGLGNVKGIVRVPNYDYAKEDNFGGIELGNSEVGTEVEVKVFDDCYPYDSLHVMKIDVEGMELQVLEGARGAIEKFLPTLYVENDRVEKSPDLIRFIQSLGYRLWWHAPKLFNVGNFFENAENLWPNIASFNMLCIHSTRSIMRFGLKEIEDPEEHILAGRKRS